jgi:twitching motility protein PilT
MNIRQLLELTISRDASDIHLIVGSPPTLRINGELIPIQGAGDLTEPDIQGLIFPILTEYQKKVLTENWELDMGLEYENRARFRVNVYRQRGKMAASLRLIPRKIRTLEETGIPQAATHLTELKQGLVLVTGPTGHGKSTTLASFINQINMSRADHIITIEDPVEFIYPKGKSLISQRELNSDTKTWGNALKAALREDPDVVLVGEMRDLDTISATMTIAETGHLVFATLHTNSAAQTIDRIIDVFPENQQPQIRAQLAAVMEAIISLRLMPTIVPGRTLAAEVLFGVPATRSLIRDGKTHLIDNLIQTSAEIGMVSMENSLANLVRAGKITTTTALNYTLKPQVLNKLLATSSSLNK